MSSAEVTRPRTSTRDRAVLRERLERWLARRFGEASVAPLSGPSAKGMSSETLLFEAGPPCWARPSS